MYQDFNFEPGKHDVTYVVYMGCLGTWILYFERLWPSGFNAFFSCAGPLWAVARGVHIVGDISVHHVTISTNWLVYSKFC